MDCPARSRSGKTLAERTAALGAVSLFSRLPPEQIQRLSATSRTVSLSKGQSLFQAGEIHRHLYAVVHGQIKLTVLTPHGDERVIAVVCASQLVDEASMFLGSPSPLNAQAVERSAVLCVPRAAVVGLLGEETRFAETFVGGLCERVNILVSGIGTCAVRKAARRVAEYLLSQCESEHDLTMAAITLPFTKQVIASQLSLTPESLSRAFGVLSAARLIQVAGRTIEIPDLRKLRDYR